MGQIIFDKSSGWLLNVSSSSYHSNCEGLKILPGEPLNDNEHPALQDLNSDQDLINHLESNFAALETLHPGVKYLGVKIMTTQLQTKCQDLSKLIRSLRIGESIRFHLLILVQFFLLSCSVFLR
jgi:hypothetical protein